jgi:hypothetical protein
MACAFRFRNYAVYVLCERGAQHHRPHAHIQLGNRRVATVFLETLDIYDGSQRLPKELIDQLREEQESLINMWIELNESE